MTAAAFTGSFADFSLVRTRNCARFVVEVPIEQADAALECLGGVPKPGAEVHVAVARLDLKAKPTTEDALGLGEADDTAGDRSPKPIGYDSPVSRAFREGGVPVAEPKKMAASDRGKVAYAMADDMQRAVTRAAMLCKDRTFQVWLNGPGHTDPDITSEVLRGILGIASRREIGTSEDAFKRFHALEQDFLMATGQFAEQRR